MTIIPSSRSEDGGLNPHTPAATRVASGSLPISVIPYDAARHRDAFAALNYAWVEKYFRVEDGDRLLLDNPETEILAKGGAILMAERDGRPVGACALIVHPEEAGQAGYMELAKMAVAEEAQGRGIGTKLAEGIIALAKARGAAKLWIISARRLETAIALYRRLGFMESTVDKHSRYERGDITMEMVL